MRVIEHLVKTLRDSAIFNPEVQVTPSCILWPDKDRQWQAVIPRLQSELGELLVLGDYVPGNRDGAALSVVTLGTNGVRTSHVTKSAPAYLIYPSSRAARGDLPEITPDVHGTTGL